MEITDDLEIARSQRLREFNIIARTLLSRDERQILYKVLKDYKRRHDVHRLVQGLRLVFQTVRKIELLKYVRYFLAERHIPEFDRLTNFHSRFRPRRKRHRKRSRLQDDRLSVSNVSSGTSSRTNKDVRVFNLQRNPDDPSLGFSVRGGSEHGLGLYISEIDEGSVAEQCGLEVGDKLLEVNNISVKGVASSSAVKVLTGSSRLKLVIQRTHKVPEWRLSKEKTSWYDVHDKKLISGDFEECGMTHFIRGLDVDVPERRINLKFGKNDKTLGFNVRGGKEYGLGIYVSKVDKTGLAEKNGVRVGDQIIDVNGIPFDNITHVHAVEVLKDKKHLILTLRDVGRFPAYKELYAEYTWSNGPVRAATSMTGLTDIHIESNFHFSTRTRSSVDLFSNKPSSALQSEIFLPVERTDHIQVEDGIKSDDNESLLDFETLANEIYESGKDNPGYESDTEVQPTVIVHAEAAESNKNKQEIHDRKRVDSNSSELNEYDHADQVQNQAGKSDSNTVEQLYAKIDKTKKVKESNKEFIRTVESAHDEDSDSNSGDSSKEDQYNLISDDQDKIYVKANKSALHSERDSIHNRDHLYEVTVNNKEAVSHTSDTETSKSRRFSLHSHRSSIHDITNEFSEVIAADKDSKGKDSDTEIKEPVQMKVQGALFSQVRRLSAASLSASSVLATSQENLSRSRESIHHDVTLQIRKPDQKSTERTELLVDKDESLPDHNTDENIDNPYAIFDDNDSELVSDGDDNNFAESNLNFSMQKIDAKITDLENRKMTLGTQELNMLDEDTYGSEDEEHADHKNTKWKAFKNIIKGSLRKKSSNHPAISTKKRGLFEKKFGQNSIDGYHMAVLDDSARRLLDDDEHDAVIRHVKAYHENHDLQTLVEKLLAILDKPEKLLLLREIRGVVYNQDMAKFDNMVNKYEIEAYEKLSMKLHLPLNHDKNRKPRRHLVTTELGERGHFHLKPYGHYQKAGEGAKANRESNSPASPHRRGSRGATAVRSITDQFDYLDHETSEAGDGLDLMSELGSFDPEDNGALRGAVIVHLSKNKTNLGLKLRDKQRPDASVDLVVDTIQQGSAAEDDSVLEVGMVLLSVDSHPLSGCTVEEAEAVLQKSYADKRHVSMKLTLVPPEESTTM